MQKSWTGIPQGESESQSTKTLKAEGGKSPSRQEVEKMRRVRRTSLGHVLWKNTTEVPLPILTLLVRKACQKWSAHLEIPADWTKPSLHEISFKNRDWGYSGLASYWRRHIVCSLGHDLQTRWKMGGNEFSDIFHVIAHEVGHMAVHHAETWNGRMKSRNHGKSGGGDEEYIDRMAAKFVASFPEAEIQGWIAKN